MVTRDLCSEGLVSDGLLLCGTILKFLILSLNLHSLTISLSRTWAPSSLQAAHPGVMGAGPGGASEGLHLPARGPVSEGAQDQIAKKKWHDRSRETERRKMFYRFGTFNNTFLLLFEAAAHICILYRALQIM